MSKQILFYLFLFCLVTTHCMQSDTMSSKSLSQQLIGRWEGHENDIELEFMTDGTVNGSDLGGDFRGTYQLINGMLHIDYANLNRPSFIAEPAISEDDLLTLTFYDENGQHLSTMVLKKITTP